MDLLKPHICNVFRVKSSTAGWAFSTSIFNSFIDTLFTEHVSTPKQYTFFISHVANRAGKPIFQVRHLCTELFSSESRDQTSAFGTSEFLS